MVPGWRGPVLGRDAPCGRRARFWRWSSSNVLERKVFLYEEAEVKLVVDAYKA